MTIPLASLVHTPVPRAPESDCGVAPLVSATSPAGHNAERTHTQDEHDACVDREARTSTTTTISSSSNDNNNGTTAVVGDRESLLAGIVFAVLRHDDFWKACACVEAERLAQVATPQATAASADDPDTRTDPNISSMSKAVTDKNGEPAANADEAEAEDAVKSKRERKRTAAESTGDADREYATQRQRGQQLSEACRLYMAGRSQDDAGVSLPPLYVLLQQFQDAQATRVEWGAAGQQSPLLGKATLIADAWTHALDVCFASVNPLITLQPLLDTLHACLRRRVQQCDPVTARTTSTSVHVGSSGRSSGRSSGGDGGKRDATAAADQPQGEGQRVVKITSTSRLPCSDTTHRDRCVLLWPWVALLERLHAHLADGNMCFTGDRQNPDLSTLARSLSLVFTTGAIKHAPIAHSKQLAELWHKVVVLANNNCLAAGLGRHVLCKQVLGHMRSAILWQDEIAALPAAFEVTCLCTWTFLCLVVEGSEVSDDISGLSDLLHVTEHLLNQCFHISCDQNARVPLNPHCDKLLAKLGAVFRRLSRPPVRHTDI